VGYQGPFADVHRHGESYVWLDHVLATRAGRAQSFDRDAWLKDLGSSPPGLGRLGTLRGPMPAEIRNRYLDQPEWSELVLEACLRSAGDSGVLLAEIRVGANASLTPGFADRFQGAAFTVRNRHPGFTAVAVLSRLWPNRPEAPAAIEACLSLGPGTFGGVDFIPSPYEQASDRSAAFRAAERLHASGFGITVHAGEFSPAHLAPAIEMPGITRIGHGTFLAYEPRLLQQVVDLGIVIECCITSNVLLGAVETAEAHPIRRFLDAGARVVLCTDNPARFGNSIAGEYALAASLGLTPAELLACTETAIQASFAPEEDRTKLLDGLANGRMT